MALKLRQDLVDILITESWPISVLALRREEKRNITHMIRFSLVKNSYHAEMSLVLNRQVNYF